METAARLVKVISSVLNRELAVEDVRAANLIERFGLSSVDALEVLIRVEGEFGIQIHDNDLSINLVSSFETLEQYVNARVPAMAS
jgi:acyl carrier protein